MDYLHRLLDNLPEDETLLLPSPFATLWRVQGTVRLGGPHSTIHGLVGADALMFCSPNVIKAFAGHPRLFAGRVVSVTHVPLLRQFEEHEVSQWPLLLDDLRWSADVTDDEQQFDTAWRTLLHRASSPRSEAQRQQERVCRRYAGQPPAMIGRQLRLSTQLAADIEARGHRSVGAFTDQSHYIRECKKLTGRTPGWWWRRVGSWYAADGAPIRGRHPSRRIGEGSETG